MVLTPIALRSRCDVGCELPWFGLCFCGLNLALGYAK
jgi:hypothetical protein